MKKARLYSSKIVKAVLDECELNGTYDKELKKMAGINFIDEQEYAPKLKFRNNVVLANVSKRSELLFAFISWYADKFEMKFTDEYKTKLVDEFKSKL